MGANEGRQHIGTVHPLFQQNLLLEDQQDRSAIVFFLEATHDIFSLQPTCLRSCSVIRPLW